MLLESPCKPWISHGNSVKHQTINVPGIGTYPNLFSSKQLSQIYNCPPPTTTSNIVIGVISLGGGLYGTVNPVTGLLTNGDCQQYWSWQGITTSNQPKVVLVSVDGSSNVPNVNDGGATLENTLDVETVGTWCWGSNVTIIMYMAANNNLYGAIQYATKSNVIVGSNTYKPSIVSISWGLSEVQAGVSYVKAIDALCSNAAANNINICVATGDNGSSNGITGNNVNCPASSAWVIACGGTSLVCPNNTYDSQTVETVWNQNGNGTGGGISKYIAKPSYQSNVTQSSNLRCIPDISLNSDPNTGIVYYVNGFYYPGVGGTSTAAPGIAGFLGRINPKYFFNPKLYTVLTSTSFHDITVGNNGAYTASNGYDLCTGFGSIIGTQIQTTLITNHVTSVSLNTDALTMQIGQFSTLTASVVPPTATNTAVTWSTLNSSVATVNSGVVSAIAAGSTSIRVTTVDGGYTASAVITIPTPTVPVIGVTTSPVSLSLAVGQTSNVIVTVMPTNATNKAVTWSTLNSAIATVNSTGRVTAIATGSTTIQVTTDNGFIASVPVTVVAIVNVTGITLNRTTLNLARGGTFNLIYTVQPSGATNKSVTLTNTNTGAVGTSLVSAGNYKLTAKVKGRATITLSTVDGSKHASIIVTVA